MALRNVFVLFLVVHLVYSKTVFSVPASEENVEAVVMEDKPTSKPLGK